MPRSLSTPGSNRSRSSRKSEGSSEGLATEATVLAEIGRIISSSPEIDEVYELFADQVRMLIPFDRMVISHIDGNRGVMTSPYVAGMRVPEFEGEEAVSISGFIEGQVFKSGAGVLFQPADVAEVTARFPGEMPGYQAGLRSQIGVPLVSRNEVMGTLEIVSKQPRAYSQATLVLAQRVGDQIAGAIANAELHKAVNREAREREAMAEMTRIISSSLEIGRVYEQFVKSFRGLVDFHTIGITVLDRERDTVSTEYKAGPYALEWQDANELPLAGSIEEEVLCRNRTVLFQTDDIDEVIRKLPGELPGFRDGIRSIFAVPLRSQDEIIAFMVVTSKALNAYSQRDVDLAERVCSYIAGAIANSELHRAVEQVARQREVLAEIGRIISSSLDVDEVYEQFADLVRMLIPFDRIAITIYEGPSDSLTVAYRSGQEIVEWEGATNRSVGGSIDEVVARTKAGAIFDTEQVRRVEREHPEIAPSVRGSIRTLVAAPLVANDQVIGALSLASRKLATYSQHDLTMAEHVAGQIAGAVANSRVHTELERSELRFRQLFDDAPVGYYEVDSSGAIVRVNRTLEEMLGYDMREMLGRQVWDLMVEAQDSSEAFLGKMEGILPPAENNEVTMRCEDGRLLPALVEERILTDEDGTISGLRSVVQDISERKRVEESIRETSRLASIGELAAGVAHEINNPLMSVAGFTELLKSGASPEKFDHYLDTIYGEAERATKVVQGLLSFARKTGTSKSQANITAIMNRALEIKSYDFKVGDIGVTAKLPKNLPDVLVDENQITQVILNLLTNAQQAMEATQKSGTIKVRATSSNGRVRLSIADNGPGIAAEILPKVFDPFFTTKEVGKGTGLGLSVSYGIVQQHDGELSVRSRPGQGATFHLELPAYAPGADSDENGATPEDD